MWQTPLSMLSATNVTPRDSSSARAASTSSTWNAIGALFAWNSMPSLPVLSSGDGHGARLELGTHRLLVASLPQLGGLETEHLAVEVHRRGDVLGRDADEVHAGHDLSVDAHAHDSEYRNEPGVSSSSPVSSSVFSPERIIGQPP